MFSYLLNRWIIVRRFKKVESGYIYRRRPDLPGILLTEEERRETLREYRRRYWKTWLLFLGSVLGIVLVLALLVVTLDLDERFTTIGSYCLAVVMCLFIVKEQREWSLLPEKRFADRPRVVSGLPTGGWLVRYQNLALRRSWPAHIGLIGLYGTALWFLTPRSVETSIAQWFLFACFGFGFVALLYGAVLKAREPN